MISKKREQRVLGWLLTVAGLGVWFYSPPGSDVVRAFLCIVLISFGTAILFAKSVREVEQVATRVLYKVLSERGRGDLSLNNPHASPSIWNSAVTSKAVCRWVFSHGVEGVCKDSVSGTTLSTNACSGELGF